MLTVDEYTKILEKESPAIKAIITEIRDLFELRMELFSNYSNDVLAKIVMMILMNTVARTVRDNFADHNAVFNDIISGIKMLQQHF